MRCLGFRHGQREDSGVGFSVQGSRHNPSQMLHRARRSLLLLRQLPARSKSRSYRLMICRTWRKTLLTIGDDACISVLAVVDHAGRSEVSMTQSTLMGRKRVRFAAAEAVNQTLATIWSRAQRLCDVSV